MTDLEMTRLCAEAMGYTVGERASTNLLLGVWTKEHGDYHPLYSDAQAMALVKRLKMMIGYNNGWLAQRRDDKGRLIASSYYFLDLNRAIVECVAKIQAEKKAAA